MNSHAVYHGFALQHEEVLKQVTGKVIQVCALEKLFLLGITEQTLRTESLFSIPSVTRRSMEHCYLLVLVKKSNEPLTAIQDKIENNLQHLIPVTAIVLDMDQFMEWHASGHFFANSVFEKGWILWQKDPAPLPLPQSIEDSEAKKENETIYSTAMNRISEFMAGAELYTIRKQYKMAAFMLHQSAEQILITMLIMKTGYRPNTHNIDKLTRYCSMFCPLLHHIFSNKESDKKLLQLLQKAYIDARYKNDYAITFHELTCLHVKIKKLLEILRSFSPSTCTQSTST